MVGLLSMESCYNDDAVSVQDSPTSKLLYNKEVQNYKTKVRKYYKDVKQLPRIPEDAMQFYLRQLSVVSNEVLFEDLLRLHPQTYLIYSSNHLTIVLTTGPT